MSINVNKVIIAGRLTKDPELKYSQSGAGVCKLNIVTNDRYKDKEGNWKDVSEFHNVTVFGRSAENVTNNCRKGTTVYVEGQLKTNKWQDQSGQTKYQTQIQAQYVMFDKAREENPDPIGHGPMPNADQDNVPF